MPQRIGELSVLPVFFKLDGRKVILAGGTKAAAWKAELLVASGANVHIYAQKLTPSLAQLITDQTYKGGGVFHAEPWSEATFKNASLAICDGEDIDAVSFYDAAKTHGVPVNVIDNPKLCDFQFGSIVNRSPVVVSISTDGAAPILGQAIRRRIEALLPKSLSCWAGIALSIRSTVNKNLKAGAERRVFWQDFSHHAFSSVPDYFSTNRLFNKLLNIASHTNVYQLGVLTQLEVDPKDIELLTLKSIRILQAADVIFYDEEISSEVLELARREAEHIPVNFGMSVSGCRTEQVDTAMKSLTGTGKNVVRLKIANIHQLTSPLNKSRQ
ncbi:MAG: NAD(P)-dependent oxidoreductase [Halopseudomonas aestusnigri]